MTVVTVVAAAPTKIIPAVRRFNFVGANQCAMSKTFRMNFTVYLCYKFKWQMAIYHIPFFAQNEKSLWHFRKFNWNGFDILMISKTIWAVEICLADCVLSTFRSVYFPHFHCHSIFICDICRLRSLVHFCVSASLRQFTWNFHLIKMKSFCRCSFSVSAMLKSWKLHLFFWISVARFSITSTHFIQMGIIYEFNF